MTRLMASYETSNKGSQEPVNPLGLDRSGRAVKQRIKTLFAGGVLALALFGFAAAGPLEDGVAAHQKGD